MKKSLVALAVLASCGAAMAQSSVTLYGIIDVGVEKLPGISTRVSTNQESNSRIGFRGVEDLGGGLQASFVVETGINGDKAGFSSNGGLATIGNRATWLSIGSKSLGKASIGRGYVGSFFTQLWADPTGNSYGQGGGGTLLIYSTANQSRFDNVIRYETPNLYGFSADLGLGLRGDGSSDLSRPTVDAGSATTAGAATRNISSGNRTGYTLHTQYARGPVYVGLSTTRVPTRPASGGNPNGHVWTVAASYDLGVVKLYGAAESDRRYNNDRYAGHVGVSAPLGAGTLMAWYGIDQNGGVNIAAGDKYKVGTVAYSYALSKRTDVYGAYTNDNVSGTKNAAGRQVAGAVGLIDGNSVQVGIRHKF
ncbi:MAG: porin [Burkholderiales bacterium]|nr:porin [Burkholderiales bacterium]